MKGFRRRAPFGTFFQNIQKSPGKGDSPLSDGTVPLAVPSHLQYHCSFHLHYTPLYWIFHTGILIAYLEKETKNPGGSMDFYIEGSFWNPFSEYSEKSGQRGQSPVRRDSPPCGTVPFTVPLQFPPPLHSSLLDFPYRYFNSIFRKRNKKSRRFYGLLYILGI